MASVALLRAHAALVRGARGHGASQGPERFDRRRRRHRLMRTRTVGMTTMWTVTGSPVGDLRVVARRGMITAIEFSPFMGSPSGEPIGEREDDNPLLRSAVD